jgi:hypothetical protein
LCNTSHEIAWVVPLTDGLKKELVSFINARNVTI